VLTVLRNPDFWRVQAMIAVVTIVHIVPDAIETSDLTDSLFKYTIIFYVFPIIYAGLRLPPHGGLLTAVWCLAVSLPDILLDAAHGQEADRWIAEVTQMGTAFVVALVISRLVRDEALARQRIQEMADQLATLNQRIIRESIRAQEEERGHIARELHDGAVQSIVLFFHRLDRLSAVRGLPRDARTEVVELQAIAAATLDNVRRLSRDLRPSVLGELGLVAAVRCLAGEVARRRGIDIDVETTGEERRLAPQTELAAFRIAQEALTNVEKHAEATNVAVRLDFQRHRVRLLVQDDGRGFVLPVALSRFVISQKLGLIGMRERAELTGGRLEVQSGVGEGTRIVAEFPDPP
jgi:signal transduction histidine kinase